MLTPVEDIVGGDETDTELLRKMAVEARDYICSFRWCLPIRKMFLADGVGGIIALFLVEFEGRIGGTDDRLWVVVGDLPSVYMIVGPENAENAKDALEAYCSLMDDWISAVLSFGSMDHVFPVDAAATPANARALRSRLDILREYVIPDAATDTIDG